MESETRLQESRNQGSEERPKIDTEIEQCEAAVAAGVTLVVQGAEQ